MSRLIWMIVQGGGIAALTYWMSSQPGDVAGVGIGMVIFINVCVVAFVTAVIVNSWDWFLNLFQSSSFFGRSIIIVALAAPPMALAWGMNAAEVDLAGRIIIPTMAFLAALALVYISATLWGWARDKIARVRGGMAQVSQPKSQSLSLGTSNRLLGEGTENRQRRRIGKELR